MQLYLSSACTLLGNLLPNHNALIHFAVLGARFVTMSKVLAHTPSWLSRPSPGFDFFQPVPNAKAPSALSNGSGKKLDYAGPSRIIAHRDTEVFYAVGNEIRWTDLVLLKDAGESQEQKCRQSLGRSRGVSRQNGNGESGIEDEDLYYRVNKMVLRSESSR